MIHLIEKNSSHMVDIYQQCHYLMRSRRLNALLVERQLSTGCCMIRLTPNAIWVPMLITDWHTRKQI
jgi:hypothetical protein